jgi:heptosyltransferase-1
MKILIVKLSAIGDVIHALPVAHFLKQAVPGVEVSWLVEQMSSSLVTNNPAIDQAIIFPGKRWVKDTFKPGRWLANANESAQFFSQLRAHNFDAVIELQGLLKSSLLARAAGAPIVAGFDDTREFADRFLTHKLNVGNYFGHDVPVVELNLQVAHYLLKTMKVDFPEIAISFPLPEPNRDAVEKIERLLQASHVVAAPDSVATPIAMPAPEMAVRSADEQSRARDRDVVLIPGTTWITKIWPTQRWIDLGRGLQEAGCRIVLIGGPAEVAENAKLAAALGRSVVDITGKTSLLELIPLFERARLVVGADTGPLHLAAAVGKASVIGVFGSTPWRRNGPYGAQCRTISLSLECQPCYSKTCKFNTVDCLVQLDSKQVLEASLAALT